ncbi:T9SS type A sorting domain-containing protein [Pseudoflavitalea rhizosphaerae]|uniref:T9SS type A sorting domain-containing protein n=1 Tax=Pseudoflavitalea rhizosphaerae TaxID=1884793 RepID=UPI000F8F2777|nr:T9SS type A sorting domain-containing protein [Pseudoflavitalea rhizosphaerae]
MKIFFPLMLLCCFLFNIDVSGQIRYANRVPAWSSQYSSGSYNAWQATGEPNTTPCTDAGTAWCPSTSAGSREWLELEYDNPAPVNRIFVHETLAPGAVDTVYVMNPNTQQWEKVYEVTAANLPACSRILTVVIPITSFPVSKVRIALNTTLVNGWNEIDAVGIANFTDGGVIGSDQLICGAAQPAAFTNIDAAYNGNPAVVYQWQDSTENGSWQPVTGANAVTYQAPPISGNTWYRRAATLNGVTAYSNSVKLSIIQTGDASEFPLNKWNFYAYQTNNIDLIGADYRGFYSREVLDFNTIDDWHYLASPASATGYQGCDVPVDYFATVARRKGFIAGNYVLNIPNFTNKLRIYINGALISNLTCCAASISLGSLDENSEVELRLLDEGGHSYLTAEFRMSGLNGGDIGEPQALCIGETPALLVSNKDAFGGSAPASITYQWQDSVANGSWTNIANAVNKTYQAGMLSVTTWFRRKAADNSGAIAYSDEIKISVGTVQGDTAVYGNQSWNVYAFNGSDITLATNSYRGYYTAAGLAVNTSGSFPTTLSPSAAANYSGCPVDNDNFVISARRQGFPAGKYKLNIGNVDDEMMLLINGVVVFSAQASNITIGELDENSKVELRLKETNNAASMDVTFVRIENRVADYSNNNCNFYYLHFVNQNIWYDFTDASGNLVLSLHPNGNNLGTMELYTKHFGTGVANIPGSSTRKFLPRNFKLSSVTHPNSFPTPVKIRLYYKNSEFADYKTAINKPVLTLNDLALVHYKGVSEDCEFSNNQGLGVELASPVPGDIAGTGFYLEASTTSFSEFSVLQSNASLPVSLTSFNVKLVMDKVVLNWSTAQELENKGFEIERSADGRNFVKIGWVDGNGNSHSTIKYDFTDASPLSGRNYYRLRQVDIDGNFSYSEISAISTVNSTRLTVSPNPVSNMLYIEYDVKNNASLAILDLQGRVLWKRQGQGTSSLISLPVQQLANGVYFLESRDKQGRRQTQKFVKQ